ncbi:MAG: BamA/TamA family outer membrane protein [Burkholderiaceae bacterium]
MRQRVRSLRARARAAFTLGLALLAALGAAPAARADDTGASPVPVLQVVAPGDLRKLLERHLDLARAIADETATRAAAAAAPQPAASAASAVPAPASSIEIGDVEWSRLVAAAPAQARALVQTEGFFAAQAHVERDGRTVRLVLEPGPAARVERVTLDAQGDLGEALAQGDPAARALMKSIDEDWALAPGAHFRNDDWASAKATVIARLRAEGYAAATWSGTSAEVGEAAPGQAPPVRIFAVADSGPLFRAGPAESISVSGVQHHEAERVRALAGFAEGAPLTELRLLDYQERLLRTGLFDQASVSLDPDAALAGQSRVLVQLKEASLQAATLGLGYSANTGPRATAEYVHRRLFGYAATARNKVEYGRDKKAWDGEVSRHPNADMQRYLVGGTYELLKTDTDRTISQRVRLGRSEDLPRLERLAFVEFERGNECTFVDGACVDPLTLKAVSGNLHNTWRRLDNNILPTRGYALNLQLGAGWATGEAPERSAAEQPAPGPYTRLYARLTGYRPLGDNWFTEGRVELGGVYAKNDVVVPDSQRFRAGGDDSVRGYPYRTLAPTTPEGGVTGGKLLFTASAEIAHPVSRNLPSVWWAAFVDAGRAADSLGRINDPSDPTGQKKLPGITDPALGYGVGVRWRSPVGPLKLDLAYGQEVSAWRVHLSVGIAF